MEMVRVQSSVKGHVDRVGVLSAIDSVMVLCGSVHTSPLARSVGRSLVDLPLLGGKSIVQRHYEGVQKLWEKHKLDSLRMRLIYDKDGQVPAGVQNAEPGRCVVERDPSPIRGVAGLLSDATEGIEDDRYIVVCNGAVVFLEPLHELVESMAVTESDVSFVASSDGSPVGVWLIRCGLLRSIKPVGYIDLKEQALDMWRDDHRVRVVQRYRPYAMTTRSLSEYVEALHAIAGGYTSGSSLDEDPYREDWESSFQVAEPGADIDPEARMHDAIALDGSRVGKGAVVVRSVLCDGAVVQPGAIVADQVVTGTIRKGRVS